MKNIFALFVFAFSVSYVSAQKVTNYPFVTRNSSVLSMDVYTPENLKEKNPAIIFMFGGGFSMGSKQDEHVVDYCRKLVAKNYVVAAIDYRLGMAGVSKGSVLKMVRPMRDAIDMAVEDLFSATVYILEHAEELKIDPKCLILNGSSSGAISVLQANYELANRSELALELPSDFNYAGVVSFSGGILSFKGKLKYKNSPAPTCFFHGTEDNLIYYNKKRIFNIGMFGTNSLVKSFQKLNYQYWVFRYEGMGHELTRFCLENNVDLVHSFIEEVIINKHRLVMNAMIISSN